MISSLVNAVCLESFSSLHACNVTASDGYPAMRACVHVQSCMVIPVYVFVHVDRSEAHIVHYIMHFVLAFYLYPNLFLCGAHVCSAVDTGLS